jgi:predicted P-loop ATPase
MYRAGERWWPEGPEENDMCRAAQTEREEEDGWNQVISEWIHSEEGRKYLQLNQGKISVPAILEHALGIEVDRQGKAEQGRVGAIAKKLRWGKTREKVGKSTATFYVPVLDDGSGSE